MNWQPATGSQAETHISLYLTPSLVVSASSQLHSYTYLMVECFVGPGTRAIQGDPGGDCCTGIMCVASRLSGGG